MKILILGGYGVFGGRLAELLCNIPTLEIIVAGRNLAKAKAQCRALRGVTHFTPLALDRDDIQPALLAHRPDILIDATGPFQDYGENPYAALKACIETQTNYIDFADGADFVFGVSQFDQAAQQAGVFCLSGVSSFPVLTAAVMREIAQKMEITTLTGGIAPSPYAGIGLNVMRAVISYAGGEVTLLRNGKEIKAKGLAESQYHTISPPGILPLRRIRFSLVDVPDLRVIPPEHPQLRTIWIGAGPVPESLHIALNLLAKLRAALRLPPLTRFAGLFYRVLNLMRFGEHRGGMFVSATGIHQGRPHRISWHLVGEGDDGPYIPAMAIEIVVRKTLAGSPPAAGAREAVNAVELADYDALFSKRAISTGFRETTNSHAPLYRQILEDSYDTLPESIQTLHDLDDRMEFKGQVEITSPHKRLNRMIARLFRFPTQSGEMPATVRFQRNVDGSERWSRDFNGHKFHSVQSKGCGKSKHLIEERFGPITVALALVIKDQKLHLIARHWNILGIPMPRFCMPNGKAVEYQHNKKFHFDVEIRLPFIGRLVHYKGWLGPE
ncbi:hypothetical protein GCM10007939_09890 [Amylibacter marinus]|uniref:Saccharopine dehydrogenase NADP binding domain-containing protein n=1 Tax=Amylibacter marinus TaxID=1475483 RepID=A0ABQ5VTW3_9RHOB|nr:SDR family oxidoreductase [Amylibacter marinus]GLQ34706.1 hypothetical protein GCM10007939_09890 [Amylibacter marinus]